MFRKEYYEKLILKRVSRPQKKSCKLPSMQRVDKITFLKDFVGSFGALPSAESCPSVKNKTNLSYQAPRYECTTENYFSYFSTKTHVMGTHKNRLIETVLFGTQNTC